LLLVQAAAVVGCYGMLRSAEIKQLFFKDVTEVTRTIQKRIEPNKTEDSSKTNCSKEMFIKETKIIGYNCFVTKSKTDKLGADFLLIQVKYLRNTF